MKKIRVLATLFTASFLSLSVSGCSATLSNPYAAPKLPSASAKAHVKDNDKSGDASSATKDSVAENGLEPMKKEVMAHSVKAPVKKSPVKKSFVGDLDTGSNTKVLKAGDMEVGIDYWSELSQKDWTQEAVKPVNLSLRLQGPKRKGKVYLLAFKMKAVSKGSIVSFSEEKAPESQIGFLVSQPYSFNSSFTLDPSALAGSTDPGTMEDERVVVTLQYDLLVQASANSKDYFKQTVLDTLMLKVRAVEEPDGELVEEQTG